MRLNLTKKIALLIGILITIISLSIGITATTLSSNTLLDQTEESMLVYATESAKVVEAELNRIMDVFAEVALRDAIVSMDWEQQKASLINDVKRLNYLDLGVVLPDGTTQYVSTDDLAQLGDRDYIKKAMNGETNISDVILSRVTGDVVVMVAAPIVVDGNVAGVLVGRREGIALNNITDQFGLGERGYAFILGADSTIYSHVNRQLVIDQRNVYEEIETDGDLKNYGVAMMELGLGNTGIVNYEFEGDNRLTAMVPIGGTSWTIGIGNYESDVLQGVNALKNIIFCIAAGVLVIGIIVSVFIARSISKRIINLKQAADQLAVGDVDVNLMKATKDEIGDLTLSFGAMADNIRLHSKVAESIAKGDLSIEVEARSDKDVLGLSMKAVVETLGNLVSETNVLTASASEGDLDTRGNAEAFNGGYKEIINGINKTLDEITKPLSIAFDYIGKMADGEDVDRIENSFKGKFHDLIASINMVVESLATLKEETINLTRAAADGDLSYRADVSRLKGGYAQIVDGVNDALNSVIEPVQEALGVLKEMAEGNLSINMEGDYAGDHGELKNAINNTIDGLLSYINEISMVLTELGNGNLDLAITGDYRGNFVEIKDSLNNIIESLNNTMGDMIEAANQVATGSVQVSDGSQALSQGSTEQASSIEELTASIAEIAEKTKQNATNANKADEFTGNTLEKANEGNEQMNTMLSSMDDINKSSADISRIIKVIDDIAFQTNILALNAAVEAARAGQHGKGFAVVAEEVRTLAARSASAASETTGLIEGSIEKAKEGTKIAKDTAGALDAILKEVEKAALLVKDIAVASNEQASGISEINKGIDQVSQVVQNNSATAEESAAASEELSSQAELLKQTVGKFRLKNRTALLEDTTAKMIDTRDEVPEQLQEPQSRIILNDNEFDKY